MKAIKCELCGSNQLKKVDGEYICQYCGTKYTLEEARKLMVEIEGTVKIDTSTQKNNYEKLAQRAYEDKLYEQAYEYYSKLLEIDCDNYMYIYKRGICAAWKSSLADFKIDEAVKACKSALKVIKEENIKVNDKERLCNNMAAEINNVVSAFYLLSKQHYEKFWTLENSAVEYWNQVIKCIECEEYAIDLLKDYYKNNKKTYSTIIKNIIVFCVEICITRRYKAGVSQYGTNIYNNVSCSQNTRKYLLDKYDKYVTILRKIEPKYVPPTISRKPKTKRWF